jgi:hypothetical protein
MMAAWILKDLKDRLSQGRTLPYWSYYNAVRFENRFKYYVAVNRNLAKLRKHLLSITPEKQFAENLPSVPSTTSNRAPSQLASPIGLPAAGKPSRLFWTPAQESKDIARFN